MKMGEAEYMAEFHESKDNPLHKDFGVLSNTLYILKKEKQYRPSAIWYKLLGIVCGSILTYFWGIFGKYVIDIVEAGGTIEENLQALFNILLIAGIVFAVLTFGDVTSNNKTWFRFIEIRMKMILERIDKALRMNYQLLEKPEVLDIHQRASSATGGNNNGVEGMMNLMTTLGKNLFTVIVTSIAVVVLDWRLIFALVIISVAQYLYFMRIIKLDKIKYWNKLAPINREVNYVERVSQDFDYAKDIRLFDMKEFLLTKQRAVFIKREKLNDYHLEMWFWHAIVVRLLYVVGKSLIYAALFIAVLKNGMSIGSFTMFLALAISFSENLLSFLQRFGDYRRVSMEVDDFRSFMDVSEDKAETIPLPKAENYEIEFHDVSYRYAAATKNAVSHLNITIHPGEKLAVVGLNGAGKTTFIKLLCRLYDPTEGYITLNGVDIRNYSREDYYKLFSPVFQNIEVFAFPIAENVSMKIPEMTDETEVASAIREAGLEDKICSLPDDMKTYLLKIVDENGVDFSGGEKQKLALARALYKNAPIVVLDEPTSALDAIAEQNLYESFDRMIGDKSAVYISHRLASTRFCDKVAMFEGGNLIEFGSHDELMEKDGAYAHMFHVQAQYYQENDGEEVESNG